MRFVSNIAQSPIHIVLLFFILRRVATIRIDRQ
jgi:hypothetical protein